MGAAIGGMLFMGGNRLLVSALSNPASSRALKEVISQETSNVVKRAAFLRLTRLGIEGMEEAGELAVEVASDLRDSSKELARELFPAEAKRLP